MQTQMYSIPHYKVKLVKDRTYKYPCDDIPDASAAQTVGLHLLKNLPHEEIIAAYLNSSNKIIGTQTLSMGGLDGAALLPRDIFRGALVCNAAAFIMMHNHPSGDPTPSKQDIDVTKRVIQAGKLLGISLLDHLVIADGRAVSIRDFYTDLNW